MTIEAIRCAICLENISTDPAKLEKNVKVLWCAHVYHKKCINDWLEKNDTCPTCRSTDPQAVINPLNEIVKVLLELSFIYA